MYLKGNRGHRKELLTAVTTGDVKESFLLSDAVKYSVPELLRPLEATSNIIGTRYLKLYIFYGVGRQSDEELTQSAKDYAAYALNLKQNM